MRTCDLCTTPLTAIGRFLVCPVHGDRSATAGLAADEHARRAPIVPSSSRDIRALMQDDFADITIIPDWRAPTGPIVERARAFRAERAAASGGTPRLLVLPGANLGYERYECASLREVGTEEFFVTLLGQRMIAVSTFLSARAHVPAPKAAAVDDALAAAFRHQLAELVLPRRVLAALARLADEPSGTALLELLDETHEAMFAGARTLEEAREVHAVTRRRLLALGARGAHGPLAIAIGEATADLLFLERGVAEDVRRAEADRPRGGTRGELLERRDRESDLEFERAMSEVWRAQRVMDGMTPDERTAAERFAAARPDHATVGVFHEDAPPAPEPPPARLAPGLPSAPPAARDRGRGRETLDDLGVDLTARARSGQLEPIVGRAEELRLVIETLCRTTKRNPVLVGPPGTGKSAIAYALAVRMAMGEVPPVLRGKRLVELSVATLLAGTQFVGDIESRLVPLLDEASRGDVILFIDELHTLVGAGAGANHDNDLAQLFKPALARGDIALVGATTEGEYRHFIGSDPALERRFQTVRVIEPTPTEALPIVQAARDRLASRRRVCVSDAALERLLVLAERHLPHRRFPDKALDLLEQCVASAVADDQAAVGPPEVERVVARLVGLPIDVGARVAACRRALADWQLLAPADCGLLLGRLEIGLRGLDLAPTRPNAVVLLAGDAARQADALAHVLATTLFGGAERVIDIDLARFRGMHDLVGLLGEPYGKSVRLVGLQLLEEMPSSVVLLRNVDACDDGVRRILSSMLASGTILDARGRQLYVSDTVAVLVGSDATAHDTVVGGFQDARGAGARAHGELGSLLGASLLAQCDVVATTRADEPTAGREHAARDLLVLLGDRWKARGLVLTWTPSVTEWLLTSPQSSADGRARMIEAQVGRAAAPLLRASCRAVVLDVVAGELVARAPTAGAER